MIAEIKAGPIAPVGSGIVSTARGGQNGDAIMSELQARYGEQTFRRGTFHAYASAVATSLAGTAMVGIQLTNTSANVVGVLTKVSGNIIVTTAALTSVVLAAGTGQLAAPTSQTAISSTGNGYLGGAASILLATNAGTFTNAPTARWPLLHNTAAIAVTGVDQGFQMDFEGSIIIPPSTYVCIATVGAASSAGGMNIAFMWQEFTFV